MTDGPWFSIALLLLGGLNIALTLRRPASVGDRRPLLMINAAIALGAIKNLAGLPTIPRVLVGLVELALVGGGLWFFSKRRGDRPKESSQPTG